MGKSFLSSLALIFVLIIISLGCVGGGNMHDLTGKKILMVIAPENFRDEELLVPKQYFEENGAQVTIASKEKGELRGSLGATVNVNTLLTEASVNDYDAVIFVGGPGTIVYFEDEEAHQLAKSFYENNKVVGAICIAPVILANAGLLEGRSATVFPSGEQDITSKGASYTGESVTVSDNIVTANGPQSAREFAQTIAQKLTR